MKTDSFNNSQSDKFSSKEIEEQIQNDYKFLEMTEKVAKEREEMEKD